MFQQLQQQAAAASAAATGPVDPVRERRERKVRRLNQMMYSPASSLPMTAFMLWMSGSDIHMFSIMITGMAIWQPLQALFGVHTTFASFNDDEEVKDELWRSKLGFVVMCFVALGVGLAKLHFMGLLPTAAADWMDHTPPVYTSIAHRR